MEAKPPKLMTPFDCLVTTDQLYTLKLLLPYTPPSAQRMLAVYVKFQEFRLALEYFQGFPPRAAGRSPLEDLKPYLRPEERETMEQMEGMMHMMELMQEFPADAAQDPGPEAACQEEAPRTGFSPLDLMKQMLSPGQQELFDTYTALFDDVMTDPLTESSPTEKKGDSKHE